MSSLLIDFFYKNAASVTCTHCKILVAVKEFQGHVTNTCLACTTICGACGVTMTREQLKKHSGLDCMTTRHAIVSKALKEREIKAMKDTEDFQKILEEKNLSLTNALQKIQEQMEEKQAQIAKSTKAIRQLETQLKEKDTSLEALRKINQLLQEPTPFSTSNKRMRSTAVN